METLTENPLLLKAVATATALVVGVILFRSRRLGEPVRELFSKLLGGVFFTFYIGCRIAIRLEEYERFPSSFSIWSWVNWSLIMLIFVFFLTSYLIRCAPVSAANRFREVVFPFFCVVLPVLLYESMSLLSGQSILSQWVLRHTWARHLVMPFVEIHTLGYSPTSIVLNILGHGLTLWGVIYLRGSFSIMTEARAPVLGGPYRWIRHPLYVGESMAFIGLCFLLPSWFNIMVCVIFCVCQRIRASFEETKLVEVFPAYREHQKKTGAFFPRWMGGR